MGGFFGLLMQTFLSRAILGPVDQPLFFPYLKSETKVQEAKRYLYAKIDSIIENRR
jgi:hypothetical protein